VDDPKKRQMDFDFDYDCEPPIWIYRPILVPKDPPHYRCNADKAWTEHGAVFIPKVCYKDKERVLKSLDDNTKGCTILEKPGSLLPEFTPLFSCNTNKKLDLSDRDQCSNLPITHTPMSSVKAPPPKKTAVVMKFLKDGSDTLQVCCCFDYDFYVASPRPSIDMNPWKSGPPRINVDRRYINVQNNSCNIRSKKDAETLCSCKKLEPQQKHIDYAYRTFHLVKEEVKKFAAAKSMTVGTGPVIETTEFDNDYECLVPAAAG
jgi:hypothetical protein